MINGLQPTWQVPATIHAFSSKRSGGVSQGSYAGLNLGAHVGDVPERVAHNRSLLATTLQLPSVPCWLQQVHGPAVVEITAAYGRNDSADAVGNLTPYAIADGAYTNSPEVVLAVLTADCLPVLLASQDGKEVAALHCGWRSIAGNIIAHGVRRFTAAPNQLHAWLGPAIGPQQFAVGAEVRAAMLALHPSLSSAFIANTQQILPGPYLADIYALARLLLQLAGVHHISGGEHCTVSQPDDFFSYRRDGETGRMASLIWRSA